MDEELYFNYLEDLATMIFVSMSNRASEHSSDLSEYALEFCRSLLSKTGMKSCSFYFPDEEIEDGPIHE